MKLWMDLYRGIRTSWNAVIQEDKERKVQKMKDGIIRLTNS